MPLPPCIQRAPGQDDDERYQTVFARELGAVAAPAAGLHFDDALLATLRDRGADPVIAGDVGHDQLAASVAADPGVIVVEGFNVRYMTPESLTEASGIRDRPSVVTGDLSSISLGLVLPAVREVAAADADIVLLIKPQFEVGRTAVKGGLVTNPVLRADAVANVLWAAWDAGLGTLGLIASPIAGTHGNTEFVAHFAPGRGANPSEYLSLVETLTAR